MSKNAIIILRQLRGMKRGERAKRLRQLRSGAAMMIASAIDHAFDVVAQQAVEGK